MGDFGIWEGRKNFGTHFCRFLGNKVSETGRSQEFSSLDSFASGGTMQQWLEHFANNKLI